MALKEGNLRFSTHKNTFPDLTPERMLEEYKGQDPFATIVSCSDSRVPVELVFDQGIGDLFVVRAAGNSLGGSVTMGSLEYGVLHLHTKLIVVMGHQKCGGITAAIDDGHDHHGDVPDELEKLVVTLREGVQAFVGKEEQVDEAIRQNVAYQMELINKVPEIKKLIDAGTVKVVGAYYHLDSGKVEFL